MATMVCMPAVSANAKDAVLAEWTVREGDAVRGGDSLGGIETDKAMVDLEAGHDGVIGRLLVEAGTRVAVGAPVVLLLAPGETAAEAAALLRDVEIGGDSGSDARAGALPVNARGADGENSDSRAASSGAGFEHGASRIFASPLARRMAADAGLALGDLAGSGPQGRIVKRDVERVVAKEDGTPAIGSQFELVPHTAMRVAIARRLTESKATIPHFYLRGQCRADALLAVRAQLNSVLPGKVSVNDLIVRGAACALRDVPDMNVTWTPQALRRHRHADISVAVATEGGLFTPIVRAADQLGVPAISAAMAELTARARGGRLAPVDYEGGSFGISNLGMHGVVDFAAIINPPQSAMLAIGAIGKEAVVDGEMVRPAALMRYTLAVDHRAIDGALAARWLARFTWYMEQPVAMLV